MRVASPFNDYSKDSLNLYRVIDPEIWTKLVGRVQGANFGAIYGRTKAMGYRNITLPEGHSWSPIPVFYWTPYPNVFETTISKNSILLSSFGMKPEADYQRRRF